MKRRMLAGWLAAITLIAGGCSAAAPTGADPAPSSPSSSLSSSSSSSTEIVATSDSSAFATTSRVTAKETETTSSTQAAPADSPATRATTAATTKATRKATDTARKTTSTRKTAATAPKNTAPPHTVTVTLSVDCVEALDYGSTVAWAITSDGVLQPPVFLTLEAGATVWDALQTTGLVLGSRQTAMGVYVYAIQSLAEKACGGKSGWIYTVNGTAPANSCDRQILRDGDVVAWHYTVTGEPS